MKDKADAELIFPKVSLLRAFFDYLVEFFMFIAPHDPMSCAIKRNLLRWRGAKIGKKVKIWRDVMIDDYSKLSVGDNVTISRSTILVTLGGVEIHDNVMMGYACKILSAAHRIPPINEMMRTSGVEIRPIVIGEDSWIASGATILSGITIGKGAVVAANSVVTKDVPDYAIVAGNPARILRMREGVPDNVASEQINV